MDTTNDYNDEPDYDQMIAEDQRDCGGPEPPSDDDTEDHMREEYNAGDRAAKRHRLGPEPTDEAITNHANGNRANAGDIPARQWEYISVDGGIPKQVYTDILPSTEGHRTNGPQGKVHADDVSERSEPPVAPGETNGTVATADDDGNAGETISNHSNSNRTNLSRNQQPTCMNTTIIDDRYASADHIEVARLRGRIIALCAACGMGKSTAIREYLRRMGNPPVMFVACRVVQSIDGATVYVLTHYQNDEATSARCVSTTVHSLNKFNKWFDEHEHDGILILDEIRSMLPSMCDRSTFRECGQLALLDKMMKKLPVIAADADLLCDGMCRDFLTTFGGVELLEYSQKPWPRTVEAVCGAAGEDYWTKGWQKALELGKNIFIHANSKARAIEIAKWCSAHGIAYKLYTSDKDSDSKDDFKQFDRALCDSHTQAVIATATMTVPVDTKEWHCDAIFVYAGSGMGCSPRDQRQAVERFGRQGPGDGPGQISEYDGVNGKGIYMLTHFGVTAESREYGPSISKEELFASKRVGVLYATQKKHRHMRSTFDATILSAVRSAPEWYTNVLAWNETEQTAHQSYVIHEWEAMCKRRGWQFTVRTGYQTVDDTAEFDHGIARPVPSELHDYVNSQTITLPHKAKTQGENTKYTRAIDILDVYGIVQSIVDRVVGEEDGAAIETIDLLEDIRSENRPNSLLTQIAKEMQLFPRVLTGEEYNHFIANQKAFHEQRNLRTKSIDELLSMDESKACAAESINLRQGRALAFMNICRELGVAWTELFTGHFQVPHTRTHVFDLGYKFDDTHASFANTLVRYLRDWAAFAGTTIKATLYKSEMRVGFEKICKAHGLIVSVKPKRTRTSPGEEAREKSIGGIHTMHANEGQISTTGLVESSLVKQGAHWVAFGAFEPEEFEMPMRYTGDTVETDLVYEELVDTAALAKATEHSEVEVARLESAPDTASKLLTKRKSQLTVLKSMMSEIVDGKIQTTYHRCFMNTGRRYANGPSLQKCSRVVRSTSARYYYDVDMRNAHPAIVAHLVGSSTPMFQGESFPSLIRYGTAEKEEREAILREVAVTWQCTRNQAKQLFVSLINAGTVAGWQGKNKILVVEPVLWPTFVHTYSTEAGKLIHLMAEEKPDIVKLSRDCIQTQKRRDIELYHKSRALNVTMQQYEDRILSVMEAHAKSADWRFDVLIYDGALLRRREDKTDADVQTLMRAMEGEIEEKIGIPIGLELKNL